MACPVARNIRPKRFAWRAAWNSNRRTASLRKPTCRARHPVTCVIHQHINIWVRFLQSVNGGLASRYRVAKLLSCSQTTRPNCYPTTTSTTSTTSTTTITEKTLRDTIHSNQIDARVRKISHVPTLFNQVQIELNRQSPAFALGLATRNVRWINESATSMGQPDNCRSKLTENRLIAMTIAIQFGAEMDDSTTSSKAQQP